MKMTKAEWNYLRKIALDHPFYDTHKLPLTEAEAGAIVAANNTLTGKEFVDSVCGKLGIARPAEEKIRFAWLRGIGEQLAVPPIRRIAIAVLAMILLVVFFAATPVGRTLADEAIHFVVRMFGKEMTITPEEMIGSEAVPEAKPELPSFAYNVSRDEDPREGIAKFIELSGHKPLVLEGLTPEEVYCCPDGSEMLVTIYRTENGGQVYTSEMRSLDDTLYIVSDSGIQVFRDYDGLYFAVDESRNSAVYVALLPDSVVCVYLKGDVDKEFVLSALLDYAE
jgi:hypothetical protein